MVKDSKSLKYFLTNKVERIYILKSSLRAKKRDLTQDWIMDTSCIWLVLAIGLGHENYIQTRFQLYLSVIWTWIVLYCVT